MHNSACATIIFIFFYYLLDFVLHSVLQLTCATENTKIRPY